MNKKGFTIIELVVVIAIIAVLAAIVLINVAGYINKGKDATIKANMHTVQTTVIATNSQNGGTWAAPTTSDYTNVTAWFTANSVTYSPLWTTGGFCATAVLKETSAGTWCVDSTGYSGLVGAATDCASSDYTCK